MISHSCTRIPQPQPFRYPPPSSPQSTPPPRYSYRLRRHHRVAPIRLLLPTRSNHQQAAELSSSARRPRPALHCKYWSGWIHFSSSELRISNTSSTAPTIFLAAKLERQRRARLALRVTTSTATPSAITAT